jgi:hypothetical protein
MHLVEIEGERPVPDVGGAAGPGEAPQHLFCREPGGERDHGGGRGGRLPRRRAIVRCRGALPGGCDGRMDHGVLPCRLRSERDGNKRLP